jgi:Tfp pilus assembly protein PilX
MMRRLRQEDGLALVMALGIMVVLSILAFSMISYTTANKSSAQKSSGDLLAGQYAESALNAAYSIIYNQNMITGGNPAAANLLACNGVGGASDTNGPSDCSSVTTSNMKLVCIAAPTCAAGLAGTAGVYGYFSGTNATASFTGPGVVNVAVPASTWLIVSTGYARNSTGAIVKKSTTATVKISALDSGAVASVWNHMFITSPLVANQCSVDFGGNNMSIVDPLYVIGNLCLSGSGTAIYETTGGQPVDLQVGGKLYIGTNKVGVDSTHPITSGVVVGGCTTVSVSSATSPCGNGSFSYWVNSVDSFVATEAPELQPGDAASDYANFDPGPKHTCLAGVTSPGTPLADAAFDSAPTVAASEPNRSGSTTNGTAFELAPNFSYSCISKNGSSVGELTWNNSTSTVNGVPGKTLKINGSIFFDSDLTISQTASYTGTAIIEVAGTITFNGNGTALCATKPCDVTTANVWQGSSTNKSMLTLASILSNATPAVQFTNNAQTFQGSIWCQPSASMNFVKNGVTIQGPISIGKFDASFNNAIFKPLPVIKNMPVGAPVPPNTSASIGPLTVTK